MSNKSLRRLVVMMSCVLVLLTVNLFMTSTLFLNVKESPSTVHARDPLPCGAIPTRFVMEEPECADKLLRSMNVTNVRILSPKTLNAVRTEPVTKYRLNLSQ